MGGYSFTYALGVAMALLGIVAALGMGYAYGRKGGIGPSRRVLNRGHRAVGYLFAASYVVALGLMVPRVFDFVGSFSLALWGHIAAAVLAGVLLAAKVFVLRAAPRHRWLLPWLGGGVAVLAVAAMYHPMVLAATMRRDTGAASAPAEKARAVAALSRLEAFGGQDVAAIVEHAATDLGISTFRNNCSQCHTVELTLRKRKTAAKWWETVEEMVEEAEQDGDAHTISEDSARAITAWLVLVRPKE